MCECFQELENFNPNLFRKDLVAIYGDQDPIFQFYSDRNFKPFWLSNETNFLNLISVLQSAGDHGLESGKYYVERLKSGVNLKGEKYIPRTYELLAMKAALRFVNHLSSGMLRPSTIAPEINVFPKAPKVIDILKEFSLSNDLKQTLLGFTPSDPDYTLLLKELKVLRLAAKYDFWPACRKCRV